MHLPDLAAQAAEPSFPYHRCSDYLNSSLPYNLSPPVEKAPGLYCMTMVYLGGALAPSTCYNKLEIKVETIMMAVMPQCKSDWDKRTGITIGGVTKSTSTSWLDYPAESVIKIFNLNLNTADSGVEICFKYSESKSVLGSFIDFICEAADSPPTFSCVKTCGSGALDTNDVCDTIYGAPAEFAGMYDYIGYGNYSCNMNAAVETTPSPPSPPPPNPHPPVAALDFPHRCYPGNSAFNGGIDTGYRVTKTPYELNIVANDGREIDIRIDGKGCDGSGLPRDCCNMDLYKIEIVISDAKCRFTDITIDGAYKPPSYAVNYYPSGELGDYPVLKLTALTTDPIAKLGSIIHLRAASECPSISEILPGNKLWYAYFSNPVSNFECCGTETLGL
ncbi:hypothetical protein FOA52_004114 [Chlamydomonas sp. UWO 241]|nr:hypothetical protein FOA52_004114 [Chlamydomonas sp. UWO 241]